MDVRIIYQPYAENMAIFVDKQPIGMISALSKYQSQPFAAWCEHILPAVALEVNDRFDLTYVGRKCEYDLLKEYFGQCPSCISMKHEIPAIGETTLLRLKKLSRLGQSGVAISNFGIRFCVYTDLDAASIENAVKSVLPRLSFCRWSVMVRPIEEACQQDDKRHAIAIVNANKHHNFHPYVFGAICVGSSHSKCEGGTFLMAGGVDTLSDDIANLLELGYYPGLLKRAVGSTTVPTSSSFFPEAFVLDKIEPQTIAKIPQSIECGETVPLQLTTIPKGAYVPVVFCKVSNESVVTYSKEGFKAVGTGEAVIEVYEQGKTVPLCSGRITAYRRNRIKSISIQPGSIRMCVGESVQLSSTFLPLNADNVSALRLCTEDGTIASVSGQNTITAKRPGTCSVFFVADKVSSAPCNVTVYPRLEEIEISMEKAAIPLNSLTKVQIKRFPADATLDNFSVRIEPSYLGTYDVGSGSIFARQTGKGRIVVQSDRSNVSQSLPIEIKHAAMTKVKYVAIGIGVGAVALLIWYLMK